MIAANGCAAALHVLEVLLRSTGGVRLRAGIGELARDPPANPSTGVRDDRHLPCNVCMPGLYDTGGGRVLEKWSSVREGVT